MSLSLFPRKLLTAVIAAVVILCAAPALFAQTSSGNLYTGDGGKDLSLAVLVPEGRGLASEQNYLPALVQGVLVSDLAKYSAIRVLDRQSLEKTLKETESGIYTDAAGYGKLGEIAQVGYALTGSLTKTGVGYAMQIQVVGTGKDTAGITKASYSGSCTVAELDDFTGIKKASLELLTQLGVVLTPEARTELSAADSTQTVNAQTALARGITAQKSGTEVVALSYFYQATAFDPSLLEAANRAQVLSVDILSGNIGDNVRNDIQWRKNWIARLIETEQYFDNLFKTQPMPCTLFYTTDLKQGKIDYQKETVELIGRVYLYPSHEYGTAVSRTLNAVHQGLTATGRKQDWRLGRWPVLRMVKDLSPFLEDNRYYTVSFELLNDRNERIGFASAAVTVLWIKCISDSNYRGKAEFVARFQVGEDALRFLVPAAGITDKLTVRFFNASRLVRNPSANNSYTTPVPMHDGELQIFAGEPPCILSSEYPYIGPEMDSLRYLPQSFFEEYPQ